MSWKAEGVEVNTRSPRNYYHRSIMEWLRELFGDIPTTRRDFILNNFRKACLQYYVLGGGNERDFDHIFDTDNRKLVNPKHAEQ